MSGSLFSPDHPEWFLNMDVVISSWDLNSVNNFERFLNELSSEDTLNGSTVPELRTMLEERRQLLLTSNSKFSNERGAGLRLLLPGEKPEDIEPLVKDAPCSRWDSYKIVHFVTASISSSQMDSDRLHRNNCLDCSKRYIQQLEMLLTRHYANLPVQCGLWNTWILPFLTSNQLLSIEEMDLFEIHVDRCCYCGPRAEAAQTILSWEEKWRARR